jgi:hypothetical protein
MKKKHTKSENKLIIAGSRTITDYSMWKLGLGVALKRLGLTPKTIHAVVSGGAPGVDQVGERWAEENGIPIERFDPDWDKDGMTAGKIRNKAMSEHGTHLFATWDGSSNGTANMIAWATVAQIPVYTALLMPLQLTCGMMAPARSRCKAGHNCECYLVAGHTTPHRSKCGASWSNRKRS